jgi:hypothetical protein
MMKPLTAGRQRDLAHDIISLLAWHNGHRIGDRPCAVSDEEGVIHLLKNLLDMAYVPIEEYGIRAIGRDQYPKVVAWLEQILAWHKAHWKGPCWFKRQGPESDHIEWLMETLYLITEDARHDKFLDREEGSHE